jgi:hypothetical protein
MDMNFFSRYQQALQTDFELGVTSEVKGTLRVIDEICKESEGILQEWLDDVMLLQIHIMNLFTMSLLRDWATLLDSTTRR